MSKVPPYRYGNQESQVANRLEALSANAPVEFDTLSEVAAELQELRNQIAALRGGTQEISFLLLE